MSPIRGFPSREKTRLKYSPEGSEVRRPRGSTQRAPDSACTLRRRIVEIHGGLISAQSSGGWTIFKVMLSVSGLKPAH